MELTIDQALKNGVESHKAGQIEKADQFYSAVLRVLPKHPEANHNMGLLGVGAGRIKDALPFFRTAIEANPSTLQFWLSYTDALIKLGQIGDAQVVFNQAKDKGAKGEAFDELGEELAKCYYRMGSALSDKGDLGEAIKSYKQAIKIRPDYHEAYNDVGLVLIDMGDLSAAIGSFKQATKANPDYAEAFYNMGIAFDGKGDREAAIESYKMALRIKSDFSEAYFNLGNTLQENGNLKAAVDNYRQAIKLNPDSAEVHNNLAYALVGLKQPDLAFANYEKAIYLQKDYESALRGKGNLLLSKGQHVEGLNVLRLASGSIFFNIKSGFFMKKGV